MEGEERGRDGGGRKGEGWRGKKGGWRGRLGGVFVDGMVVFVGGRFMGSRRRHGQMM